MSVLIKGMEMPADCALMLKIFPDGTVGVPIHLNWCGTMVVKDAEAVPVPPHGRLGDLDAAVELVMQYCPDDDGSCSKEGADLRELLDEIENLPTIIPADTGTSSGPAGHLPRARGRQGGGEPCAGEEERHAASP